MDIVSNIKNAAVITIGNEILSGKTIDSNSAFIASSLTEIGITVNRILSVADSEQEILWAVKSACESSQLVISTGGLGPTKDDITKKAVAKYFKRKIIPDENQLEIVKQKFKEFGYSKMPETNISQAEIPEDAVVFSNPRGTAPGLLIKDAKNLFLMLPGVPEEMRGIIGDHLIPYLKKHLTARDIIISRTIRTTGMGESKVAEIIDPVLKRFTGIEIAFLPDITGVDIRLTAKGNNKESISEKINEAEKAIVETIPKIVYGFDDDTLELVVGRMLTEHKLKIAVAESCTGGLIGDRITSISGSSDYFERGIVSYSNESKIELLGVKKETIMEKGAVSEEVAAQMAEGLRAASGCDICVSSTGIAGPNGGTKEKPVGLVYIGLSDKLGTVVKKLQQRGERERIKRRSAQAAINLIRTRLHDTNFYRG